VSNSLQQDVDLSAHNSFGVQARAAWFVAVDSSEDALLGLNHAREHQLPVLILGAGSNVLLLQDFPGVVLHLDNKGIEVEESTSRIRAAAGENWHELVQYCMNNGLHGLENLALIPGTVGAAPVQNIGAYGVELSESFVELEALNLITGELEILDCEACDFEYRDSLFKRTPETPRLILNVTLQLSAEWQPRLDYHGLRDALPEAGGNSEALPSPRQVFDTVCAIRRSKLPDPAELGNAGSFFKNPVVSQAKYDSLKDRYTDLPGYPDEEGLVKIPAAWLIEQSGWKGKRRGAAGVHTEHALVLVNHGGASGEDIFLLAQAVSASVLEGFGIALSPEVRLI